MIRSFACKETRKLFDGEVPRRLPGSCLRIARRKLLMIDAAASIVDLKIPPGNRLEALAGDRRGQHSVRVNDQFRICFRWDDGAWDVEIVDYH